MENHVNVGGPQDNQRGKHRPQILDYEEGLRVARDYLGKGFSRHGHYVENAGRWLWGGINGLAGKSRKQPREDERQPDVAASRV